MCICFGCCFIKTPLWRKNVAVITGHWKSRLSPRFLICWGQGWDWKHRQHQVYADPGDCAKASKLCTRSASRRSALAHLQGRAELLCQASYAFPASPHMVSGLHGTHSASHRPRWPPLICRICRTFWGLWPAIIFVQTLQQLLITSALLFPAVAQAIHSEMLSISIRRIPQGHRCWASIEVLSFLLDYRGCFFLNCRKQNNKTACQILLTFCASPSTSIRDCSAPVMTGQKKLALLFKLHYPMGVRMCVPHLSVSHPVPHHWPLIQSFRWNAIA